MSVNMPSATSLVATSVASFPYALEPRRLSVRCQGEYGPDCIRGTERFPRGVGHCVVSSCSSTLFPTGCPTVWRFFPLLAFL